jgi:DnaJ-class molecular chaperone
MLNQTKILGGEYELTTLDGKLKVKIPEGTSHGDVLRIKGKGVPTISGRGDLLIKIGILIPKSVSKKAKNIIDDLKQEGL